MIRYDLDGSTLFYLDASGQKVSANWYDVDKYTRFLAILQSQNDAVTRNRQVVDDYTTKLENYKASADNGRPAGLLPTVPQQKMVDDLGAVTYVDFVPALPTYQRPLVASGSTSIVSKPTTPSDNDVLKAMLTVINSKLDKLLSK